MAHQHKDSNTQAVNDRVDITGHRVDGEVSVPRGIGPAMAPEIERERPPGRPEVRKLGGPMGGASRQ
jgi:hypothetical protein